MKPRYLVRTTFSAARSLPHLPQTHPASRLHGHCFRVQVEAEEAQALETALRQAAAVLDYNSLNELLPTPSDEHLARWFWSHLRHPDLVRIHLQSTDQQGVILNAAGQTERWQRFRFESTHRLPRVPPGHRCGRMHGHGFSATLCFRQSQAEEDSDPDRIQRIWIPFQEKLQGHCLNELPGLENPTSELLATWLWQHIQPIAPELVQIQVQETGTAGCTYDGNTYRIWKEHCFESALRRDQGHSYRLRLYLQAPLDPILGWTLDYGEVKTRFRPLYRQLDHHQLDEQLSLEPPDLLHLARWIEREALPVLPALTGIELWETPVRGVRLGQVLHALPD